MSSIKCIGCIRSIAPLPRTCSAEILLKSDYKLYPQSRNDVLVYTRHNSNRLQTSHCFRAPIGIGVKPAYQVCATILVSILLLKNAHFLFGYLVTGLKKKQKKQLQYQYIMNFVSLPVSNVPDMIILANFNLLYYWKQNKKQYVGKNIGLHIFLDIS